MQPPYPSANAALKNAYYLLANPDLGLRGALVESHGSGGGSPQEQIASAAMTVQLVKETITDPYLAAIEGGMIVVNWNAQIAWSQKNLKFTALLRLGTRIECPSSGYKAHALAAWSGLYPINDDRWAKKLGRTTRTLRRWRHCDRGIWTTADQYLRIALGMAEDEMKAVGLVEY